MSNKLRVLLPMTFCMGIILHLAEVRAEEYEWSRTVKVLTAVSRPTATLQGEDPAVDEDISTNSMGQDAIESSGLVIASEIARGGGGGGGGAGALAMGGANGPNGVAGSQTDGGNGSNGPGPGGMGGQGGKKGDDGEAAATLIASGVSAVNADDQVVLSWSFIHEHDVDFSLLGAGAGGGGGGGGGGFFNPMFFNGYHGGAGGNGLEATGEISSRQETEAEIWADLNFGPSADEFTSSDTLAWIEFDLEWGDNGVGDIDCEWTRGIDVTITLGEATLTIQGGPTGAIVATGMFADDSPFEKESLDLLEDTTGGFAIGPSEFVDEVTVGEDVVSIITDGEGGTFSEVTTDEESADPGLGGGGGQRGTNVNGADGTDQPQGTQGGDGGTGGAGNNAGNGGIGGTGGYGDQRTATSVGTFQGVINVFVDG